MNPNENPFITRPTVRHEAYPFDQVHIEHYLPAIEAGLSHARAEMARIGADTEAPTFENTIEALECADDALEWVTSCYYSLKGAEGPEEMHALAQEIEPRLAAYANDVALDSALFARIRALHDQRADLELSTEQHTVLEKH